MTDNRSRAATLARRIRKYIAMNAPPIMLADMEWMLAKLWTLIERDEDLAEGEALAAIGGGRDSSGALSPAGIAICGPFYRRQRVAESRSRLHARKAVEAEAVVVGASAKDSTPAAWCRRVLLREAELVRKDG